VKPTILTASGINFDFDNPVSSMVCLEDIAHALAHTCRFGGHVREFYSVAQHCVMASHIVPAGDALWALMHDASEAYVGDMPKPLKNLLPDYQEMEQRVEKIVLEHFGLFGPMPSSVKPADLVMLATEQRDLMPPHDDSWAALAGIEPLAQIIHPWPAPQAKREFIARFWSLRNSGI